MNSNMEYKLKKGKVQVGTTSGTVCAGDDQRLSFRGALVYANATIDVNSASPIPFNAESYDTSAIHDNVTNNTRLTVPSGVTRIRLSGQVTLSQTSGGTFGQIVVNKNGSSFIGSPVSNADLSANFDLALNFVSPVLTVSSGDYFEIYTYDDGSSTNNVIGSAFGETWFAMEIIE